MGIILSCVLLLVICVLLVKLINAETNEQRNRNANIELAMRYEMDNKLRIESIEHLRISGKLGSSEHLRLVQDACTPPVAKG